jgi:hypothetical protein
MRRLPLLIASCLAGCAAPGNAPSLAPRPAEAIDPRVPIPDMVVSPDASLDVLRQLELLVAQAQAGDESFRPAADRAESLAAQAGPAQSESWIVAQQALSAAIAARAPVTGAMGDIDALTAARIERFGGIAAGDLAAINAASARIAEIDSREAAKIERIEALLAR